MKVTWLQGGTLFVKQFFFSNKHYRDIGVPRVDSGHMETEWNRAGSRTGAYGKRKIPSATELDFSLPPLSHRLGEKKSAQKSRKDK